MQPLQMDAACAGRLTVLLSLLRISLMLTCACKPINVASRYQYACLANASQFNGKVVCDVGCGTGILSFFAARAGARKVYGVDASNMADHARALVESNGLEDVITIVKGKIEDIELPEKVWACVHACERARARVCMCDACCCVHVCVHAFPLLLRRRQPHRDVHAVDTTLRLTFSSASPWAWRCLTSACWRRTYMRASGFERAALCFQPL